MEIDHTHEPLRNRTQRYTASVAIHFAISILRRSHQLYRAGLIDLAGVKRGIHWSDELWRFGWGLLKRKRHSR
jgi:hypothetical protein